MWIIHLGRLQIGRTSQKGSGWKRLLPTSVHCASSRSHVLVLSPGTSFTTLCKAAPREKTFVWRKASSLSFARMVWRLCRPSATPSSASLPSMASSPTPPPSSFAYTNRVHTHGMLSSPLTLPMGITPSPSLCTILCCGPVFLPVNSCFLASSKRAHAREACASAWWFTTRHLSMS